MPPECEADARVAADCGAKLQHDLQDLFGELAGIADDVFAGLSGFDFSLLPQEASFCSAECEQFLQSFNCTTNASGAGDFLAIKYGRSVRRWPPRGGALPASAHGGGGRDHELAAPQANDPSGGRLALQHGRHRHRRGGRGGQLHGVLRGGPGPRDGLRHDGREPRVAKAGSVPLWRGRPKHERCRTLTLPPPAPPRPLRPQPSPPT